MGMHLTHNIRILKMVRRVPCPLAAKDIEKKSKFNGAKSGHTKKFFFEYSYVMS